MRAILLGIGVAAVAAVLAAVILWRVQEPAYQAYSSSSTRIGNPGANLVGQDWRGNPQVGRNQSDDGDVAADETS